MLRRIREIAYETATFDGRGFDARYRTDTGLQLRVRSVWHGMPPEALAALDTTAYARLWGLFSFGALLVPHLPVRIHVQALSLAPDEQDRVHAWFLGILSEALYRSDLPAELDLRFSGERLSPRRAAPGLTERAVLMSGGGKDSAVAGELLKRLGVPFRWFSLVGDTSAASREIARVGGDECMVTSRWHHELEGDGGFQPVVPRHLRRFYRLHRKRLKTLRFPSMMGPAIEASLLAEATASRHLLIGNERSANEGNGLHVGALEVNHQFGKSYPFEREFAALLRKYLHPDLRYASLLMPFYELQLARIFAEHPEYFPVFRSCNRQRVERPWCRRCPKCAFVFLMLSAFVDEADVREIFGADLLADPELESTFLALCGRGAHKPLECVGLPDESRLALWLAYRQRGPSSIPSGLRAVVPDEAEARRLEHGLLGAYDENNGLPGAWNEALRVFMQTAGRP